MSIISLSRSYPSRRGAPIVNRIEDAIFYLSYCADCMGNRDCVDACCRYGVDVDRENAERLLASADALEAFSGLPRKTWFTGAWRTDAEFPGGASTRTAMVGGRCVFSDRRSRGCRIHGYCISAGIDYHELKPMVSTLFPITFEAGILHPSAEAVDGELACLGGGSSLYDGLRGELGYYFGPDFVAELDALRAAGSEAPRGSTCGLPEATRTR